MFVASLKQESHLVDLHSNAIETAFSHLDQQSLTLNPIEQMGVPQLYTLETNGFPRTKGTGDMSASSPLSWGLPFAWPITAPTTIAWVQVEHL